AASHRAQLPCLSEPVTDGVGIAAGACERCQLRLGAQSLGTEPDVDVGDVAGAHSRHTLAYGFVGVRPAALPQRELADERMVVVHRGEVLAQGGRRGFEVGPRGLEVAAADLEV